MLCQKSILKTCDELQPETKREREGEKKGVGVEVGGNNSYSKSFQETANDPWGEMESTGLVRVSNSET